VTQKHFPLRSATSIDAELAKPHPEELTEIKKEKERSDSDRKGEKAVDQRDQDEVEAERYSSDRWPI
jgi:hypothetical protein